MFLSAFSFQALEPDLKYPGVNLLPAAQFSALCPYGAFRFPIPGSRR